MNPPRLILTALLLAPLAAIYAADTPVAPQKPSPAQTGPMSRCCRSSR